jgi:hypothetical protein
MKDQDLSKVIETKYNGYNFRSRTEARWAVFFDALEVDYQYEPNGFKLPNGEYYLPDFYLPEFGGGGYFEVKPLVENERQWMEKLEMLSDLTKQKVFILNGPPDFRYYGTYDRQNNWWYSVIFCGGDGNYFNKSGYYVDPDDTIGTKSEDFGITFSDPYSVYWRNYVNAVNKSRSERF